MSGPLGKTFGKTASTSTRPPVKLLGQPRGGPWCKPTPALVKEAHEHQAIVVVAFPSEWRTARVISVTESLGDVVEATVELTDSKGRLSLTMQQMKRSTMVPGSGTAGSRKTTRSIGGA